MGEWEPRQNRRLRAERARARCVNFIHELQAYRTHLLVETVWDQLGVFLVTSANANPSVCYTLGIAPSLHSDSNKCSDIEMQQY